MKRGNTGRYIVTSAGGERVQAFVPHPLPPSPPLTVPPELQEELDRALLGLGRLNSAASFLPDTNLLLYLYIRKEAVLSSQIEGTQSSLSDLLLFEIDEVPGVPLNDVREVSRYVAALSHGLERISGGFPLSLRLIKEIHEVLLSGGRGSEKSPGEFRRSQNWIGGTRPGSAMFVPPPPNEVLSCMGELELFLHNERGRMSSLIKAALAHVQFETIHPFLDGNGRVGRLLITLILCHEKLLAQPLLYLSLYFKEHREQYYNLLQSVRSEGDWEAWLTFFANAVRTTAEQCTATAERLTKLAQEDRKQIQALGRIAGTAIMVQQALLERPLLSIKSVCEKTGLVPNTVNKVFRALEETGIVAEITGKSRNRIFVYREYLRIMNEGSVP